MSSATWLLTGRTLLFESVKHLPGSPTDNHFECLAPAAVLVTTVPGIANAAVGLATDIQSRYLYKLLTMPVSIGSIMAGRLLAGGTRLFIQGGGVLLLATHPGTRRSRPQVLDMGAANGASDRAYRTRRGRQETSAAR